MLRHATPAHIRSLVEDHPLSFLAWAHVGLIDVEQQLRTHWRCEHILRGEPLFENRPRQTPFRENVNDLCVGRLMSKETNRFNFDRWLVDEIF